MFKHYSPADLSKANLLTTMHNWVELTGKIISFTEYPCVDNIATIQAADGQLYKVFFSRIKSLK